METSCLMKKRILTVNFIALLTKGFRRLNIQDVIKSIGNKTGRE